MSGNGHRPEPLEDFITALAKVGCGAIKCSGGEWEANCPAHPDADPSLGFRWDTDSQRVLFLCRAGCSGEAILDVLGLTSDDTRIEVVYEYLDEDGASLYSIHRGPEKKFWTEWNDEENPEHRRVPYRLPEVIEAVAKGETVYVVEGEKDADNMTAAGACATTNPHGAGKWRDEYSEYFRGATVVVVADKDDVTQIGYLHATKVARSLRKVGATVTTMEAKEGKDSTDHLDAGYGVGDFIEIEIGEPSTNGASSNGQKKAPKERSSWGMPVDLRAISAAGSEDAPTMLLRSDGVPLVYPGLVHDFHGESESGKSWAAQFLSAERLLAGERVLYLDFEDIPRLVLNRMRALGIEDEVLFDVERFLYLRPEERLDWKGLRSLLDPVPSVGILDGVNEAMSMNAWSPESTGDVALYLNALPKPLANLGMGVVCIDHVTKDKTTRGRYAIGSQHKLTGIWVSYEFETISEFGRGRRGSSLIRVSKDRPGYVREKANGKVIAEMEVDARIPNQGGPRFGDVKITFEQPSAGLGLPRCEGCGSPFVPANKRQRFCDPTCRQRAYRDQRKHEDETSEDDEE